MITKHLPVFMAITLVIALVAGRAQAGNVWWDGGAVDIVTSGNGASAGATGTWNTTTLNWDAGVAPHVAWINANNDTAIFGGTVGIVTLGTGITVGGLQFSTTAYTISNNSFTLSFGALTNAVTLNCVAAATLNGQLGGSGAVTLSAALPTTAGTLTLNGTSTAGWSGATIINPGLTLAISQTNQALLNTSGITLNGGGITLTAADSDAEKALDRVSNSAGITANGGTITYTTTTAASTRNFAETIGVVDLITGQLNIVETLTKSAGTQIFTLTGLTRTGAANSAVITFSSAPNRTTFNQIIVSGATQTAASKIIGPWATIGTSASAQTNYAVFTAASQLDARATPVTADDTTWSTTWADTSNYALNSVPNLTASRAINTLCYLGAAGTLTNGNFDLQTYGLLNGGSGLLTVTNNGSGVLTTPTGGGNLYLTSGNRGVTVFTPIADNGAVTLVASGSGGTLTLSGANTYSGGTVLNAGTVGIAADNNLGNAAGGITFSGTSTLSIGSTIASSARTITLNSGATATISLGAGVNYSNSGKITGSGNILFTYGGSGNRLATLSNTGNDFTGAIGIDIAGSGQNVSVNIASLADGVGYGNIRFGTVSGIIPVFTYTGASDLTLANRQIEFINNGTGAGTLSSSSGSILVNTSLSVTGTGAKTLLLDAAVGVTNTFAGNIGNGAGTVTITKSGAGTWKISGNMSHSGATSVTAGNLILSGTNTYSGLTGPDNAALTIRGQPALSPNSTIAFDQTSGSAGGGGGLLKLWMDDIGTVYLGNQVNLWQKQTSAAASWTISVGNNGGTTVGSTLALGKVNFPSITDNRAIPTDTLNVTGANGYRLQFSNVDLATILQGVQTFNPSSASITITGAVMQISGKAAGNPAASDVLGLSGSASGNRISGIIKDAADYTDLSNTNARPLSINKTGTGDWTLSGNNTYSGTNTVSAGTLYLTGNNTCTGAVTITGGTLSIGTDANLGNANTLIFNGGILQIVGTTLTSYGSPSSGQIASHPVTLTATKTVGFDIADPANTFTVSQILNQTSGGLTKAGVGTLALTAVNTFTGATTLNRGTLKLRDAGSGLTQTLGTLALAGPDVTLQSENAGDGTLSTTFTTQSRAAGNSANIVYTGGTIGTDNKINFTQAAGFIDKGIFLNGTNYAAMNALNTYVRGMVYNTDANSTNGAVVASKHVRLTTTLTNMNTVTLLSLNLTADGVNYTQNANMTNTVPGILKANGGTSTYSGGNALTAGAGVELVVRADAASDTLVVSTPIIGTGALTKSGAGTLTLAGVSTYSGASYVNGGTFEVGGSGQLGSGVYSAAITNYATLLYSSTVTQTLAGVISGPGALVVNSSSKLTLTATNTYTGPTVISAGTFEIGSAGLLGSGFYAANITNNGTLLYSSSSTQVVSGAISGGGGLVQSGTGLLILTGANTFTGNVTVNGGKFSLQSALDANATVTVASGATLALNYAGTNTIHKLILNGGAVGSGAWGAVGSGAANTSSYLSGSGVLLIPPASGTSVFFR